MEEKNNFITTDDKYQKPPSNSIEKNLSATRALKETFRYTLRESSRNKGQFFIGTMSVCLVVFNVAILITTITISPVVFLKIAESVRGETDLVLRNLGRSQYSRLNYTKIQGILDKVDKPRYSFASPRLADWSGKVYKADDCIGYKEASKTFSDGISLTNNDDDSFFNTTFLYKGPPANSNVISTDQNVDIEKLQNKCLKDQNQCVQHVCNQSHSVSLWLIDTDREREINIGRTWDLPKLEPGAVYINKRLAKSLDLSVGDKLVLTFDFQVFKQTLNKIISENYNTTLFMPPTNHSRPIVTVKAIFDPSYSTKFPKENRSPNLVIAEYGNLVKTLSQFLHPDFPRNFSSIADGYAGYVYHEAQSIAISCNSPRYVCYIGSDYTQQALETVSWASDIVYRLGVSFVSGDTPVLKELQKLDRLGRFLTLISSIVIMLLCALSIFLIYNLLMGSVETRTFELGILRMIGTTRHGIMVLLLVQASTYAIPAWMIGISTAQITFLVAKRVIEDASTVPIDPMLTPTSVAVATILGLLVPAISTILPIRKALGDNLRDSLDKRGNKTKAVVISLQRNKPGTLAGMEPLIATGAVLTIAGFMIYYFLPKALVENDLTLLFNIFFAIIIGLLFGIVLLATNVQPLVERFLIWLMLGVYIPKLMKSRGILFLENKAMKQLLSKNLLAHKLRNRKTATMFSFAIGFLVFLNSSLAVQLNGMEFDNVQKTECDMLIRNYHGPIKHLEKLEGFIDSYYPYIKDFTYISHSVRHHLESISNYRINGHHVQNIGRIASKEITIRAVSPNFLKVQPHLSSASKKAPFIESNAYDITESLYAYPGNQTTLISTFMIEALGIRQDQHKSKVPEPSSSSSKISKHINSGYGGRGRKIHSSYFSPILKRLTLHEYPYPEYRDNILEPIGFLDSAGFIKVSNYPIRGSSDALVSYPTFVDLAGLSSVTDIRQYANLIYIDHSITNETMYTKIFTELQDLMQKDGSKVVDLKELQVDIVSARQMISVIFNLATLLILLITLFSLNITMIVNVWSQKGEIGVLRALGVRRWSVFRLYVYEAFVIVFASGVLGIAIGVFVGWTMSAQQSVLSERPFSFPFPYEMTIIIFFGSVLCAIVSTAGPVMGVVGKGKSVVSLLK